MGFISSFRKEPRNIGEELVLDGMLSLRVIFAKISKKETVIPYAFWKFR